MNVIVVYANGIVQVIDAIVWVFMKTIAWLWGMFVWRWVKLVIGLVVAGGMATGLLWTIDVGNGLARENYCVRILGHTSAYCPPRVFTQEVCYKGRCHYKAKL